MRRHRLVAGLVLATLAAPRGEACDRRLRDLIPPEDQRSPLETTLLGFIELVEDCVEKDLGTPEERRAEFARAMASWRQLYEEAREQAPPATMTATPEEYRLVLEGLDDIAGRMQRAWDAGDRAETDRLEYGLQHVVGELYGANPGQISKSRAVHYTVTSYQWLAPLTPETLRPWKVRTDLLELRLDRWLAEVGADAEELGSVRLLRSAVAGLQVRLAALADTADAGAEPLRSFYVHEVTAALKDLDALAKRTPGAVLRASWSRKGVPKDLQPVPPREMYPALDRPAGT